jgi:chemotaxis protein CheX
MASLPVQYINPFFQAARKICSDTIKVPVSAGPMRLRRTDERLWKLYPISATIRLNQAVQGSVSLSFAEPVALALAGGLAQTKFGSFDDDARDALGEVANLIVGSAKRDLPGGLVSISTPRILLSHELEFDAGIPTLILPFETAPGRFILQLTITCNKPEALMAATG